MWPSFCSAMLETMALIRRLRSDRGATNHAIARLRVCLIISQRHAGVGMPLIPLSANGSARRCRTGHEWRSRRTCQGEKPVHRGADNRGFAGILHVLKIGCRWCDCRPSTGRRRRSTAAQPLISSRLQAPTQAAGSAVQCRHRDKRHRNLRRGARHPSLAFWL